MVACQAEVVRKGVPALDGSTSSSSTQGLQLSVRIIPWGDLFKVIEALRVMHFFIVSTITKFVLERVVHEGVLLLMFDIKVPPLCARLFLYTKYVKNWCL